MRHLVASQLDALSKLQSESNLTGPALYDLYDSAAAAKAEAQLAFFPSPADPDCTSLLTHSYSNRGSF